MLFSTTKVGYERILGSYFIRHILYLIHDVSESQDSQMVPRRRLECLCESSQP